jgi:hypothetical protein
MQFRDIIAQLIKGVTGSSGYLIIIIAAVCSMTAFWSCGSGKYSNISVKVLKSPSANLALDKVDDLIIEIDNQGDKAITYLMVKILFRDQYGKSIHKIDYTPIWADEKMYSLDPSGKTSSKNKKYKPLKPNNKLSYSVDLTSLAFRNTDAQTRLERNWEQLVIQARIIKAKFS